MQPHPRRELASVEDTFGCLPSPSGLQVVCHERVLGLALDIAMPAQAAPCHFLSLPGGVVASVDQAVSLKESFSCLCDNSSPTAFRVLSSFCRAFISFAVRFSVCKGRHAFSESLLEPTLALTFLRHFHFCSLVSLVLVDASRKRSCTLHIYITQRYMEERHLNRLSKH